MVDTASFPKRVETRKILDHLPEGMSEDDFVGVIKLAMLTECATDIYADAITSRAKIAGADWLATFNEEIWKPDEYMHAEPFKLILLGLDFSEAELDRKIDEVQHGTFIHNGGDTPVNVSTFGMVQEYLTDHFHGLIADTLKPTLPEAAHMTYEVKRRETLHMVWYRTMTSIQVASQPELIENVAFEISRFQLPGNTLVPELQSQAERWLNLMGADIGRITRELGRLMYQTAESPRLFGQLVLDIVDKKDLVSGRIKPRHVKWVMEARGGWGYTLLGEAILERAGLDFLFRKDFADAGRSQTHVRIRNNLRTWVANKLPKTFTQVPSSKK